jgi:iron complex outermembrane receptor protein
MNLLVKRLGRSLLASVALAGMIHQPAQAQSETAPQASPDASGMEIVVTAQRREQRLTEVPVAVQAISAETLERSVVVDSQDILKLSSAVNFTGGYSPIATSVTIRGISSTAQQGQVQPSTSVLVDDVALSTQAEFVSNFNDIERVELLRGPQGTLFGKNATAGVVNITTKRPTADFEATVEGGYTTDEELLLRGTINLPISAGARVRVNGFRNTLEPIVPNLDPNHIGKWNRGVGAYRNWGVAGKLALDLADGVDLLISGDYTKRRDSFGSTIILVPDTNPFLAAAQINAGVVATRNNPFIKREVGSDVRTKSWGVSANLGAELSDTLSLRSITAYRKFSYDAPTDFDSGPWAAVQGEGFRPNPDGYPFETIIKRNGGFPFQPAFTRYTSQEFRLNYSSGPLDVVGGLYAQWYTKSAPDNANPFIGNFGFGRGYFANRVTSKVKDDIYSIYGDATYELSDQFSAFGGLRYSWEKVDLDYATQRWAGAPFDPIEFTPLTPPDSTDAFTAGQKRKNLSGRAGLRFTPDPTQNYYISFNRGYKGPAVDTTYLAVKETSILKPEIATAFEVGVKQALFDNRLLANLAVFYQRVENVQQAQVPPGTIQSRLVNAGDIRSYGAEFDFIAKASDALRLDGGLTYVNAQYRKFSNACYPGQTAALGCDAVTGRQDLSGAPAIGQPKWSANLSGTYDIKIDSLPFDMFVKAGVNWQSKVSYSLTNDPLRYEPGFALVDATIGLVGRKDRWQLLLYGKNLTDKQYYVYLNESDNFISRISGNVARDSFRYFGFLLKLSI